MFSAIQFVKRRGEHSFLPKGISFPRITIYGNIFNNYPKVVNIDIQSRRMGTVPGVLSCPDSNNKFYK